MKAIVEHYAKGEFQVDRPEVAISEKFLKLNIESGTLYEGVFTVNSTNDHVIKAMVYDSRYMLRFNQHTFIAKNFDVGFTFDATCLEAGKITKDISVSLRTAENLRFCMILTSRHHM